MFGNMKFITNIIAIIVGVLIIVTTIGVTASLVDDGSEAVTQDARCSAAGCFWNATRTIEDCTATNTSISDITKCGTDSANKAYTGESLFNTGGIVILAFIGAALIALVGMIWFKVKN